MFFSSVRLGYGGSFAKVSTYGRLERDNCANVVVFLATFGRCMFSNCSIRTFGCLLGPVGCKAVGGYLSGFVRLFDQRFCCCRGNGSVVDVPCGSVVCVRGGKRSMVLRAASGMFIREVSLGRVSGQLPIFFVQTRGSCVIGVGGILSLEVGRLFLPGGIAVPMDEDCLAGVGGGLLRVTQ